MAAAIGAIVVGSATIGAADARPGSPLWPIAQVLWPERATSAAPAPAARSAPEGAHAPGDAGRTGQALAARWPMAGEPDGWPTGSDRGAIESPMPTPRPTVGSGAPDPSDPGLPPPALMAPVTLGLADSERPAAGSSVAPARPDAEVGSEPTGSAADPAPAVPADAADATAPGATDSEPAATAYTPPPPTVNTQAPVLSGPGDRPTEAREQPAPTPPATPSDALPEQSRPGGPAGPGGMATGDDGAATDTTADTTVDTTVDTAVGAGPVPVTGGSGTPAGS